MTLDRCFGTGLILMALAAPAVAGAQMAPDVNVLGEPVGGGVAAAPAEEAGTAGSAVEAPSAGTSGASFAPVEKGPIRLEVSLSERVLRVIQGGEVVKSYPVAVGQAKHPTPKGDFNAARIVWNPRWVPPAAGWARGKEPKEAGDPNNPMGRVKIFFRAPDYYIHGTNNEESLGTAASHGCVRMANDDVLELARVVMEHGGERRSPDWFHRVVNFVKSTREVRLSSAVPVTVRP